MEREMSGTETDVVERAWRCDVTGNPVGTDTVMIGASPCDCQGCRAAAEIDRLRSTSQAGGVPAGWLDIDTAPKDGTWVLLWAPDYAPRPSLGCWSPTVCAWEADTGMMEDGPAWSSEECNGPTHWHPLPSEPGASPPPPPTVDGMREALTFAAFSAANRDRCEAANGFNHPLGSWTASDWVTAIVGELGEAANIVKKLNRYRDNIPGNKETADALREKLRREIGDTFVYLDLLSQSLGFDLAGAAVDVFDAKSEEIGYPVRLRAALASSPTPEATDDVREDLASFDPFDPAIAAEATPNTSEYLVQATVQDNGSVTVPVCQWHPIETAPLTFNTDVPASERVPWRLRMGGELALLGMPHDDGTNVLIRGCWAAKDDEQFWWDLDGEEPVDWPIVAWAHFPGSENQTLPKTPVSGTDATKVDADTPINDQTGGAE
jgi:NTP pyrophosphatase (non-canonical NTP hydrolase)